jgi:TolB-like protein
MVLLIARRLLAVLAVLLVASLALPARAAAKPSIEFFPFVAGNGVPPALGAAIAQKIATDLTAVGGVGVMVGDPATQPVDFRVTARNAGADAYLTGSLVSVGTNSYAGIEQLVSARSGVLIWSRALTFRSVDDLTGNGQILHDLLLVAPAAPSTAGTLPTDATPAPGAAAAAQFGGILVLPADGTASRSERDVATQAVTDAVKHLGFQIIAMPRRSGASSGLCSTTHARLLVATRLETARGVLQAGGPQQTTAIVSMTVFNCQTDALDPNPVAVNRVAPETNDAIRGAVTDALVLLPALPLSPNG